MRAAACWCLAAAVLAMFCGAVAPAAATTLTRTYEPPLSSYFASRPAITGTDAHTVRALEAHIDSAHACVAGVTVTYDSAPRVAHAVALFDYQHLYSTECLIQLAAAPGDTYETHVADPLPEPAAPAGGDAGAAVLVDMRRWAMAFTRTADRNEVRRFTNFLHVHATRYVVRIAGCPARMDAFRSHVLDNRTVAGSLLVAMAQASCAAAARVQIARVYVDRRRRERVVDAGVAALFYHAASWELMQRNVTQLPRIKLDGFELHFSCRRASRHNAFASEESGEYVEMIPARIVARAGVAVRNFADWDYRHATITMTAARTAAFLLSSRNTTRLGHNRTDNATGFMDTVYNHVDAMYRSSLNVSDAKQRDIVEAAFGTTLLMSWLAGAPIGDMDRCLRAHAFNITANAGYIEPDTVRVLTATAITFPVFVDAEDAAQSLCGQLVAAQPTFAVEYSPHIQHAKRWRDLTTLARVGRFPHSNATRNVLRTASGLTSFDDLAGTARALYQPTHAQQTGGAPAAVRIEVGVASRSAHSARERPRSVLDGSLPFRTKQDTSIFASIARVFAQDDASIVRVKTTSADAAFGSDRYVGVQAAAEEGAGEEAGDTEKEGEETVSPHDGLWLDRKHTMLRMRLARAVTLPFAISTRHVRRAPGGETTFVPCDEITTVEFRVFHGLWRNVRYQLSLTILDILNFDTDAPLDRLSASIDNGVAIAAALLSTFLTSLFGDAAENSTHDQPQHTPRAETTGQKEHAHASCPRTHAPFLRLSVFACRAAGEAVFEEDAAQAQHVQL